MRIGPREVAVPTLVLVGLLVALVATVGYGAATSDADFGPHNPSWEGVTELRAEAEAAGAEPVVLTDAAEYDSTDANGSVAFVLAPGDRSPAAVDALQAFVERGGTVVVATRDPEHGNALLAALGTDARVDGALLRDEEEHRHGPAFPTVASTASHPAVEGVTGLSLNHGSALVLGGGARQLANSSSFAYLDEDGDGAPGPDETLAARPVIAAQSVGQGDVIATSDPSVFVNAMLDVEPNRRFVANLVAGHDRVLVDRTDEGVPPLRAALAWVRGWSAAPLVLGLLLVGLAAAWERRLLGRALSSIRDGPPPGDDEASRSPVDREALDAYVADRYPDWDPDRRERVLGGVMSDGPERRDDD